MLLSAGGARSWIVELRRDYRASRVTLGRVGEMPSEAARLKAIEARAAVAEGASVTRPGQTVTDLWEAYKADHFTRLAAATQRTVAIYWTKHILPKIGLRKVRDLRLVDVEDVLAPLPDTTANRVHETIRRVFGLAVKWGWIKTNPAVGIERRRTVPRADYLTGEELGRALAALPENEVGDLLRFVALTGCRFGEAAKLEWSHISADGLTWVKPAPLTKQRREHRLPLSTTAVAVLARRPRTFALVFARPGGGEIIDARKTWHMALARVGIRRVRVHDLRHSHASLLLAAGATLPLVGAALGHSTPAITARYAHVRDDMLRAAIEGAVKGL